MSQNVSVIATVKDEADSIEPFLLALLNQTRPPDEIIISDGGSTDSTPEIIRGVAAEHPTLRLIDAPGTNIASGRNVAIRHCSGPIVAVTDAGAVPREDWLEQLVKPLDDSNVDMSGGFFIAGGTNFIERCISVVITPQLHEIDQDSFLPSSRSLAFRKEWWERTGGYPEWLDHSEDIVYDLALKRAGATFQFAAGAIVTWHPRSSLGGFARQYFFYARGDAHAGLWPERHAVRYGAYLALAWLLGRVRRRPTTIGFIVAGARPYLRRYYQRVGRASPARTPAQAVMSRALVPVIVVVGDVAKMAGYAAGHVERTLVQRGWSQDPR
jgi:glycosyltransferase involved in cell wall biosynthesis